MQIYKRCNNLLLSYIMQEYGYIKADMLLVSAALVVKGKFANYSVGVHLPISYLELSFDNPKELHSEFLSVI